MTPNLFTNSEFFDITSNDQNLIIQPLKIEKLVKSMNLGKGLK